MKTSREVVFDRRLLSAWRALVATDILYKAIAFTVLTPLIGLLLRLLVRRSGTAAVADVDIVLFFFTSWQGAGALVLIVALIVGVTALEQACLMTIVLAALRGLRPNVRDAFAHAFARSFAIVRLTALLTARVLAIVAPFAAVLGLTYWLLLTGHDINYYLTDHPPEFWTAAAIGGVVLFALTVVLARKALSWLLALPLVVFESVPPARAFAESAMRMRGRLRKTAGALAAWAALAIALPVFTVWGVQVAGRAVAPAFAGSVGGLLMAVGFLALIWGAAALVAGIITAVGFAWVVVRRYAAEGGAAGACLPEPFQGELRIEGRRWRVSWRVLVGVIAAAVVLATGAAQVLLRDAWTDRPVAVIAHRGASAEAPENSLAAFRLAGRQHTDYVELDVQESADGVVMVVHDSDLMKVAGSPLKIWEATAGQLRAVDIGSRVGVQFAAERVPTLEEALAVCKGVSRVNIELKYYGHNQQLEQRVVELVEAAGMENDIVTMSLRHEMTATMKRLRPGWSSGLLSAKALGNLSQMTADFLAVEQSMATRRFIGAAHRAGKPVYVWTVDDPARMIRMIGLGVDGLITNRPDVARSVLVRLAGMTKAERLLFFVMTTLGAEPDTTAPDSELRP